MIKESGLIHFSQELGPEAAKRYWRETHGPLGVAVPAIGRYVQNHFRDSVSEEMSAGAAAPPVDGYASLWWPDEEAMKTSKAAPEFDLLAEDVVNFLNLEPTMVTFFEENVVKDGEYAPFKIASFAVFKEGLDPEQARAYWAKEHAALTLEASGFTRYVQNYVLDPVEGDGSERPAFDGIAEHWFRDEEDFRRAASSPEWRRLVEDGENLFEMDKLAVVAVEEIVFVD